MPEVNFTGMNKKFQSLRGMNDIDPSGLSTWKFIESRIFEIFTSYGYQEIRFPLIESTDAVNKDNAVDTLQEEENEKESPMECVKHGNSLTSMQTHMGNFQKKYQKLMSQLNNYGTAAAAKTSIDNPSQINSKIDELIDEVSTNPAEPNSSIVGKSESFCTLK